MWHSICPASLLKAAFSLVGVKQDCVKSCRHNNNQATRKTTEETKSPDIYLFVLMNPWNSTCTVHFFTTINRLGDGFSHLHRFDNYRIYILHFRLLFAFKAGPNIIRQMTTTKGPVKFFPVCWIFFLKSHFFSGEVHNTTHPC